MSIRIYNTLSRQKENFDPITPGHVRLYVCGPTVYDDCHIGHARSVVFFDTLKKYFEEKGLKVIYARNFTDIDDKIIKRANERNRTSKEIAETYIKAFYRDMDALYVSRATFEPRATDHIDDIIQVIENLIQKDFAYCVEGDVYFRVNQFEGYGKLSGRSLDELEAGARVAVDQRKQSPHDFALWKSAKPNEPFWESPWGKGRPGWHIECSAMGKSLLGDTFDIHGGGKDLIFPHHENEIAQSEAAFGRTFVKYWMHNGLVNINHEKMAKSLGNFVTIQEILTETHPETIRIFLLSNHYRHPLDYTEQAIQEADGNLIKLYSFFKRSQPYMENLNDKSKPAAGSFWDQFQEAMDDDLNTARGFGILFETIRATNRLMDQSDLPSEPIRQNVMDAQKMTRILGLINDDPDTFFTNRQNTATSRQGIDAAQIDQLIAERLQARKTKNWPRADEIRDQLAEMDIVLEDRPEGTIWKYDK
ncbi:cysteine--tRNA ligase [Desulfobacterales bacterium HSG17]|nr:cysteine--tRNA ligase [Desulfobacterales bacterium HSG17]